MEIFLPPRQRVVLHGVLARDEGKLVGAAGIGKAAARADELGQLERAVGVAGAFDGIGPAEIVQRRHLFRIPAQCHVRAHRLVDGALGHVVGVMITVARTDAMGDRDAP